jgi:CheY-like chemotaxis protein/anti-sigma regulatory factor (Ser/Thr protein kinase)
MRGSHLTHHLLAYARKQMLWPQAIDLETFLPEIKALLARTLGPHVAIDVRVLGTPQAIADPGELQTALINLAINAAQAMTKGGILRIDARQDRSDSQSGHGCAEIILTDTGVGMDAETLAQAVEPFFSTRGAAGTGLGLSMVQGFAEQSGGTLRITSTPDRGTVVSLRLPAGEPRAPRVRLEPMGAISGSGRVLLVDDSTDALVTVGAFLSRAGFDVTSADSGDRALHLIAAGARFDAVVTDYAMPGLNGTDLIIQARDIQPGMPAIVISGYASVEQEEIIGGDNTVIMHKPFQRRDLIATLQHLIGGEAPPAPGKTPQKRQKAAT